MNRQAALIALAILGSTLVAINCRQGLVGPGQSGASTPLGDRTKTAGCQVHAALPDPACTPGAAIAGVTAADICHQGYTKRVRDVTVEVKRAVYAEYGMSYPQPSGAYEVDHLVPLEVGGSNDIANLWPQAASPGPGFHQKDGLENYLNRQVCEGKLDLPTAQSEIAHDWLGTWKADGMP